MDPLTIMILTFLWSVVYVGGHKIYDNKVLVPRRVEAKRVRLETEKAECLALEMKREQDAALTLEDKIWLFDMGRTEWTPEDEVGFTPQFNGTDDLVYHYENHTLGSIRKAHLWNLPDWYVDFLTTRPFHSALAKHFYDWACQDIDPKTRIAEMKQKRDDRIAAQRAAEEEKNRRWREHQEEVQRIEQERLAKAKAERLERERREREERKERALALEESRRKKLGLTGTYLDTIRQIYRDSDWHTVRKLGQVRKYAPGTDAYLAVKELQRTFGLPVTGCVDMITLHEMQVQAEVDDYVKRPPLRLA